MQFISVLESVTLRSICFSAGAILLLWLLRTSTAAARHAALTVVAAGMLLLVVLTPLMPAIPLRVLPASRIARVNVPPSFLPVGKSESFFSISHLGLDASLQKSGGLALVEWITGAYLACAIIFLLRLAFGYLLMRRLIGSSRCVGVFHESDLIAAPVTAGWLRPRIVWPSAWREWEVGKLRDVLTHERMHVRRADWAISILAALNRCLFWYNPLAWWLERRLAILAEQACDDAALLQLGDRESYARTLLDVAAAVRSQGSRLKWQAMAMARPSEVHQRIERILDSSRNIPRGLTTRRWAALAISGFAAVCLTASLEVVPVLAQQREGSTLGHFGDWRMRQLTADQVAQLESEVDRDSDSVSVRSRLILHYLIAGMNEPRAKHVLWMIEHHPEAEVHRVHTLFGDPGPLQDIPSYVRAAALWQQQAALHANDPVIILNAARFFDLYFGSYVGDLHQAEEWIRRARSIEPRGRLWPSRLALYYSSSLLAVAGLGERFADTSFAQHARAELERSTDGALLEQAGYTLAHFDPGQSPELIELSEFGKALLERAAELGYRPTAFPTEEDMARIAEQQRQAEFGPQPLKKVDAIYPPVARQARIQGTVRLSVLIAQGGTVQKIETLSGHPLLLQAARTAVSHWIYPPQTIDTLTEVEVPFRLGASDPRP